MTDDELNAMADDAEEAAEELFVRRRRSMTDFRYDEAQAKYWDVTTGSLLCAKSVDGAIPRELWPTRADGRNGQLRRFPPAEAINDVDTGLTVEGSTWWPGKPQFIENVVVTDRGALEQKGAACYNSYVPASHKNLRTDKNPDDWINHVKFIFPDPLEHEHFFDFAAHMAQRPDEKVNHGIVIAGAQGIGKDTALLPLRRAVGEWNVAEVEPDAITSDYNGFVKSVMLVINEVRPHDEDFKASNFYNKLKPLLAAPPELIPMNMKYFNVIYVRNLCHVILTTNDPLTMYIPGEDRRLFVMTSPIPDPKRTPIFAPGYFDRLHAYLADGGVDAVIRWLLNRSLSEFNSSAPPPMTTGKEAVINSTQEVRRGPIDEVFEAFVDRVFGSKPPEVFFAKDMIDFVLSGGAFDDADKVVRLLNAKNFHFKMDERGYALVKSPTSNEWKNGKFRSRAAYVRKEVPGDQREALVVDALSRRPLTFVFE